jgi:RHS repeat-associated protein
LVKIINTKNCNILGRISTNDSLRAWMPKILKVNSGDKISVSVNAFYTGTVTTNSTFGNGFFANFITTMINQVPAGIPNADILTKLQSNFSNTGGAYNSTINSVYNSTYNTTTGFPAGVKPITRPKAYLLLLFYDQDFNLLKDQSYLREIQTNTGIQDVMALTDKVANVAGYCQIACVNEFASSVFFDKLNITHKNSNAHSVNEYYPFGLQNQQTSSTQFGSKDQRYKYNGKELLSEFKLEAEDYGARLYSPQIGRWIVIDPLAEKMKRWSPYTYAFDNPIRFIDPDGRKPADHYFNKAGKYVGSDGSGNNIRITAISTKAGFEQTLKNIGQTDLRASSKVVTVKSAEVVGTLAESRQTAISKQVEQKSYIILDTKEATLSLQRQPQTAGDKVDKSENLFDGKKLPNGDKFLVPDGGKGNEVIVGQTHEHIANEVIGQGAANPGPSGGDVEAAKELNAPVYPIDSNGIHKVDQNGNTSTLQSQNDLLIDALKTYSGAPK